MAWQEEFKNHPVWNKNDALAAVLDNLHGPKLTNSGDRLRALVSALKQHAADPQPSVTTDMLNTLSGLIDQAANYVSHDPSGAYPNSPYTSALDGVVGQMAAQMRNFPLTSRASLSGLSVQIGTARADLEEIATDIESARQSVWDSFREEKEQLQDDLKKERETLDQTLQNQYQSAQENIQMLAEERAALKSSLSALSESVESLSSRAGLFIDKQKEELDKIYNERAEQWDALIENANADMDSHEEEMKKHRDASENLLAAVGANATASDYGAYAEDQRRAADKWRRAAVFAYIAAASVFIFVLIFPLFRLGTDLRWWEYALQKLTAPAGLAAVGYFFSRESGQHREQERGAKRTQLTLASLEPFIVGLPHSQQKDIRMEVARSLFTGGGLSTSTAPTADIDEPTTKPADAE